MRDDGTMFGPEDAAGIIDEVIIEVSGPERETETHCSSDDEGESE